MPQNREGAKNSGGKRAGRSPAQVSAGIGCWFWLGAHTAFSLPPYCMQCVLTHLRRALFRVFDIESGQIEDILGIILVKEFFKKSN